MAEVEAAAQPEAAAAPAPAPEPPEEKEEIVRFFVGLDPALKEGAEVSYQ